MENAASNAQVNIKDIHFSNFYMFVLIQFFSLAPTHAPLSGPGCSNFDGGFIPEGEWWHPTLPDYGVVTCVNCTCQVCI